MTIIIVLSILLIYLLSIEIISYTNRRKANKYIKFLTKNINPNETNKIAAGIVAGSGLLSLYDLYANHDNHKEVLDSLGSEWKNVLGEEPDALKIYSLFSEKSKDSGDLINLKAKLTGHYGEIKSLEHLKEKYDGQMTFENANILEGKQVPGYDIIGKVNDTGKEIKYSVKNYTPDDINNLINDMNDSFQKGADIGVIPLDTYQVIEKNGLKGKFNKQIIPADNLNSIENDGGQILDDIINSGDFSENFILMSLLFFGLKTIKNTKLLLNKKQSRNEYKINVAMDFVRVGSIGIAGGLGFKIGAFLGWGSPIGPIGGGVVGGFIGAVAGGKVIESIKNNLKWGNIFTAREHFSKNIHMIVIKLIALI